MSKVCREAEGLAPSEFVGEGAFEFSQMAAVVQAASEKANRM